MATANIYDLIDTWNDGATTFTAIKMDVTDTASASDSLLLDLQVGGVSKFSVGKGAGAIFDTNLIEQRNGANAQTFNLYNTFTDASNYERGFMKWNSNVLEIGTEAAGTGTVRTLALPATVRIGAFNFTTVGNDRISSTFDWGYAVRLSNNVALPLKLGPNSQIGWTTVGTFGSEDAGIARAAAAQLKVTDGSTGAGELIFIVPTTDPGITGALWNNAGTLSISA